MRDGGSGSSGSKCRGSWIWRSLLLLLLGISTLAAWAALRASRGTTLLHQQLHTPSLCPRRVSATSCMGPCAPLSAAAQQLLNGSTLFTLLASTSTPGTLALLRHMQRDLGSHRVFLTFDDTNAPWTLTPAQRLTAQRGPAHGAPPAPVLLFNRSEADAVAGRLAGRGGQNYYEAPAVALLYRYLKNASFEHVWRIEVGGWGLASGCTAFQWSEASEHMGRMGGCAAHRAWPAAVLH